MKEMWLSAGLFLATFAAAAGTPPSAHPASPALRALPTATSLPGRPGAGTVVHTILNSPEHSPEQLDFGAVWNGQLSKRTFVLTTNANGYVAVTIPAGPFRIAEFREMGVGGQSVGGGAAARFLVRNVKTRITYQPGQSGPFQWSLASGAEIQVDVVFEPRFDLATMMAGPKSATMKVTGPGPKGGWTLSIPMHGMFNGLQVRTPLTADWKEVYAVPGDTGTFVNLTLTGLGSPVSGTLKGGTVPAGVSVVPKKVNVPAGQLVHTSVSLTFSNVPTDGIARPLEILFDDGTGISKASLSFAGLPKTASFASGQRGDCGVSRAELKVSLTGPSQSAHQITNRGYVHYELKGWNLDLINRRYVWMVAESGGVRVLEEVLRLLERNADEVKESDGQPILMTYENWARVIRGPARFGCQLSERLGAPIAENLKWAPAAP
jgi:hypothetical protein